MRISDWSSDVCSSDLHLTLCYLPPADQVSRAERALLERDVPQQGRDWRQELRAFTAETDRVLDLLSAFVPEIRALDDAETSSEARRVGKECVSTCRSRWAPSH